MNIGKERNENQLVSCYGSFIYDTFLGVPCDYGVVRLEDGDPAESQ
jgi:hypothetical protein